MSPRTDPAEEFLRRLNIVEERLQNLATTHAAGLTDADARTGERWDVGQLWAHVAEFIPYWVAQAERVVHANQTDPVPFGRTKANPERIAAIERERHLGPAQLWPQVREDVSDLRGFLREMPDNGWDGRGRHETLGVMSMREIVEEFLVGHLEEHAAQLEKLDG